MNSSQFPLARKNGLVIQEVPNEVLVLDLNSNKAHCLNETAALVWKSCDGNNSVSDIANLVKASKGAAVSDDLVWLAIDQLNESNLLEARVQAPFPGTSRREALKKIGLASMIALPIVASLAAPKSAMASTSCFCDTNADCTLQAGCSPVCTGSNGSCVAADPGASSKTSSRS
ncbi:MAG: PqqD family protein [Blastocatellia bacterium]|nr:PqqD family protein [Blastocatellia bacterium]